MITYDTRYLYSRNRATSALKQQRKRIILMSYLVVRKKRENLACVTCELVTDGTVIGSELDIANCLNNKFVNVGSNSQQGVRHLGSRRLIPALYCNFGPLSYFAEKSSSGHCRHAYLYLRG